MSASAVFIRSRDNELVQRLRRLIAKPGGYRDAGQVWLEGDHLCRSLLEHGGLPLQAVITEQAWEQRLDLRELAQQAPRVAVVPPALMKAVSTLDTPAALSMLAPWPQASNGVQEGVATVVMDRLQDPGNVGSILRSAAALGVRQVLALQGTVALWSAKVLRAGMGAHFGLRLVEGLQVADLKPLAAQLVLTTSHGSRLLHEAPLPAAPAWVFGHEGAGVDEALAALGHLRVTIPQPGGQESLNVAAAAAVCLYEGARRQWQQAAVHTPPQTSTGLGRPQ